MLLLERRGRRKAKINTEKEKGRKVMIVAAGEKGEKESQD